MHGSCLKNKSACKIEVLGNIGPDLHVCVLQSVSQNLRCTARSCVNHIIRTHGTHGSGSYVGLASWAWFSNERYKTVTKRCL